MPITTSKKQSDLEKRLKLLRQQVYGKESVSSSKYYVSGKNTEESNTLNTTPPSYGDKYVIHNTDLNYLYQDLLKIGLFASIALGSQLLLFFLLKNNILKLNLL